jgi:tripartite-type tricarboxylate transporter receptor subunit TctC
MQDRSRLARREFNKLVPALLFGACQASAQSRPARMIIGFPVGGGVDAAARPVVAGLARAYPAGIIVESKPGATGRIAVEAVKNSPPDGATMLFTPDFALTIFPHSYRRLGYDPINDLTPVAMCGRTSLALCVGPMVPETVKRPADLVRWLKANPQFASFASTGPGGTPHFAGTMFARAADLNLTHVPYKGGAPALQDIMGGQIALGFNPLSEALPQLKGGRVRVLATTGQQRSQFLPDVPTMIESGYKEVVTVTWMGVFMPARTPRAIVAAASAAINEVLATAAVRDAYAAVATEVAPSSPESLAASLKADIAHWEPIVRASGFTAEE